MAEESNGYCCLPCFFGLSLLSGRTNKLLPSLQLHAFPSKQAHHCRGSLEEMEERDFPREIPSIADPREQL